MRRVLCIWLPTFSTDLVKRRLGVPRAETSAATPHAYLLTRRVASREVVTRRCALSAAAGIAEGMDLAHARSLLPDRATLHVETHRPDRDEAALRALACWAVRFSPVVAPDFPDGLMLDITGTDRLHRGETRLVRGVASGLARLGFRARVTAAATFGCAWGVSRYGTHELSRVHPRREREAMAGLPAAALRIDVPTVLGLGETGITTVGDVLSLPRASLAARFDASLLRRVQQALGEIGEPIEPVRPDPPARAEMLFDGPTDQWESVEAATRQVLEHLVAELSARERGVRRLDVQLLKPRTPPACFEISLSRPSRAPKHLWTLVRTRLERADLGEGIEGVVMTASRTARLRHEQTSCAAMGAADGRAAAGAWGELMDTLVGRLGAENVVRIEAVESHLPERACRTRSVMEAPARGEGSAATGAAPRPTLLFPKPECAQAISLTPEGPVLELGWRGRRWMVAGCTGPERIAPEWWRWGAGEAEKEKKKRRGRSPGPAGPPPDREYFVVQTVEGRWLWVCRHAGTSRWFVHGEWT